MKKAIVLIDYVECPRNVLIRLRIEDYLKANHWDIVNTAQIGLCDLIVFSSCGYTETERKKGFKLIEAVQAYFSSSKKSPVFIVTGCLPKTNEIPITEIYENIHAFGFLEFEKFDTLINAQTKLSSIPLRT